jgi:hypothetical protein
MAEESRRPLNCCRPVAEVQFHPGSKSLHGIKRACLTVKFCFMARQHYRG